MYFKSHKNTALLSKIIFIILCSYKFFEDIEQTFVMSKKVN